MLPNTQKLFNQKPIRWDQHCLLVIQFPISFQTEIRRSARFSEVKRALREGLDRFAPRRALDLFLHPALMPFPAGLSANASAGQGAQSHPSTALSV